MLAERRGDEVVAPALEWWRAQRGRPRFLWVHLYDPHARYQPPEPFATRYAQRPLPRRGGGRRLVPGAAAAPHLRRPRAAVPADRRPPTTARRWASTARTRTGCSPTRRRCTCRWCCGAPASQPGRDARAGAPRRSVPDACSTAARLDAPAATAPARPGPSLLRALAGRAATRTSRRCRRRSTAAGRRCAACCAAGAQVHRAAAARGLRPDGAIPRESRNLLEAERRGGARGLRAAAGGVGLAAAADGAIGAEEEARLRASATSAGEPPATAPSSARRTTPSGWSASTARSTS